MKNSTKLTEIRPCAIEFCSLIPEPRNGRRPDSNTCSMTPAPQTSQPFPYKRRVTTSGAI